MREILFRGKRIDNGRWVKGGVVHQIDFFYGDSVDRYFIIDIHVDIQCDRRYEDPASGQHYVDRKGMKWMKCPAIRRKY